MYTRMVVKVFGRGTASGNSLDTGGSRNPPGPVTTSTPSDAATDGSDLSAWWFLDVTLFYVLLGLMITSYLRCVFTEPGVAVSAADEGAVAFVEGLGRGAALALGRGNRATYCRKCQHLRPARAHHCAICRRCVLKMDHHCPWWPTALVRATTSIFTCLCLCTAGLHACFGVNHNHGGESVPAECCNSRVCLATDVFALVLSGAFAFALLLFSLARLLDFKWADHNRDGAAEQESI